MLGQITGTLRTEVALATQVFEHVVLVFSLHMIIEDGPGVVFVCQGLYIEVASIQAQARIHHRCNFVLFYAVKMAVAIVSLCINESDQICTQPDQKHFLKIYIDALQGVAGVSKYSQNMLQIKVLSSWPFGSQNIKNRVFRFELFSIHLPLFHSAETRC